MMIGRRNGGTSRDDRSAGPGSFARPGAPSHLFRSVWNARLRVERSASVMLFTSRWTLARKSSRARLRHGDRAAGSGAVRRGGATSNGALTDAQSCARLIDDSRRARVARERARAAAVSGFYSSGALLRRVRASAPRPAPLPSAPRGRVAMRDPRPRGRPPRGRLPGVRVVPPAEAGSRRPPDVSSRRAIRRRWPRTTIPQARTTSRRPRPSARTTPSRARTTPRWTTSSGSPGRWRRRGARASSRRHRSTEAERMRRDLAHVDLDPARRDDDVHDDDDDDDWDWDPDPPGVPASGGGSSSESEPALFPSSDLDPPAHHPPALLSPSRWAPGPATAPTAWTTTTATHSTSSTSSHWSRRPARRDPNDELAFDPPGLPLDGSARRAGPYHDEPSRRDLQRHPHCLVPATSSPCGACAWATSSSRVRRRRRDARAGAHARPRQRPATRRRGALVLFTRLHPAVRR